MGVNKVILVGNLGKDPELRMTTSQFPICNFSLATGERKKDQSGNWVDHTEWHNIVVLGKSAQNCAQYLKKGKQVFIEGKIQTRKWQDKEGKDRYTTEILAGNVQFLSGARDGGGASHSNNLVDESSPEVAHGRAVLGSLQSADSVAMAANAPEPSPASFDDDDIPF